MSAENKTEIAPIESLKPHPRNYRNHPDDQLEHIVASLKQHGFYRNVVVAKDDTILAGHGLVMAAKKLGLSKVPVIRLDVEPDSPVALKVLTGDNELVRFAEVDDRVLTDLLKEIRDLDTLLGTGFDDNMLAALTFNTRPASELNSLNETAEWLGMPEYENGSPPIRIVITFPSVEEQKRFAAEHALTIDKMTGNTWSTRWPYTEKEDVAGLKFEREESASA